MVKILSFLDDDGGLGALNSENMSIIKHSSNIDYSEYYDIVLYDTLSFIGFEDVRLQLTNRKIYRIAILDDMDELDVFRNYKTDAWLLRNKISSHFPKLLTNLKDDLNLRVDIHKYVDKLENILVHNDMHFQSFEILKNTVSEATKGIENNFETRVKEIREVNSELSLLKDEINAVKEVIDDEPLLINPVHTIEKLINKNDETIKSLFDFVMILQCEDKINQLIDGMVNVISDDTNSISSLEIELTDELKKKIKEKMINFFYLQDQRDVVLDVESKDIETGTLTLF